MKRFSEDAQRLFQLARYAHEPPASAKAQTLSRLQAQLSAGAALGLGAAVSKSSIAAVATAVGKGPLLALLLVGAGGVGFGVGKVIDATRVSAPERHQYTTGTALRSAAGSKKASAVAAVPVNALATATAATSPSSLAKNVPAVVRVAPAVTTSEPPDHGAASADPIRLAAETQTIRQAHQAMVSGNVNQALALLDEHARQFPSGVLAEERVATQIIAHCRLGQFANAQARLNRFANTWPQSPHLARIRSACRPPSSENEK